MVSTYSLPLSVLKGGIQASYTCPGNSDGAYAQCDIAGPYPCEESFFDNCNKTTANRNTGSTLYVGAPAGTGRLMTILLTGRNPPANECRLPPD